MEKMTQNTTNSADSGSKIASFKAKQELQDTLYTNLIQQVESDLNRKFAELIRKKDFFSYVKIDRKYRLRQFNQRRYFLIVFNLLLQQTEIPLEAICCIE